MARKKNRSGQLNRGPWTGKQIADALASIGYREQPGGEHPQYEHPERPGKMSVKPGWSGVKAGSEMFNSIARQSHLGKDALLRLMNGLPLEDG